jgi:uncharacterized Ntn-hydrolase superfamily protein
LVVRDGGGYGGFNDRYIDLRVDDAVDPVGELARLLTIHSLFFDRPLPDDGLAIDGDLAVRLQSLLRRSGDLEGDSTASYDARVRRALRSLMERENLEERWFDEARIDRTAWEYLQSRYPSGDTT